MMECEKTEVFFKEKKRMCDSCSIINNCLGCPIQDVLISEKSIFNCTRWINENVKRAIELVQDWSDSHKPKTRKDVFLEHYPDAVLHPEGHPKVCAGALYGYDYAPCTQNTWECIKCWDEPVKEE